MAGTVREVLVFTNGNSDVILRDKLLRSSTIPNFPSFSIDNFRLVLAGDLSLCDLRLKPLSFDGVRLRERLEFEKFLPDFLPDFDLRSLSLDGDLLGERLGDVNLEKLLGIVFASEVLRLLELRLRDLRFLELCLPSLRGLLLLNLRRRSVGV